MKHLNVLTILQTGELERTSEGVADTVMHWMSYLGLNEKASSIIGGIIVLIVGFFVAKYIAYFVKKLIAKTGVDDKLKTSTKISAMVGKLVYFILMIIVLMTTLNIMGVGQEVMEPLNNMVQKFANAIPNILIAGIIIYAGYFLAKIIAEFVEFAGDTLNNIAPKLQLPEGMDLAKIVKTIVFILVFVPVLIVGLDFLHFDTITEPATSMLSQFMNSIPLIIKAAAILVIAIFGGKLITSLLKDLLTNLKVDNLAETLGIKSILGNQSLSNVIANVAFYFIVYLAIMQVLDVLNLEQVSQVMNDVLYVAGKIALGLVIVVLGNLVANFAVKLFSKGEGENSFSMVIMKSAIIAIFLAMGLSAMDIADSIVNLAFGLALGAIAVAFALSFGLGGKEAAGEQMKKFFDKFNKK